jgi:hypothetical protein
MIVRVRLLAPPGRKISVFEVGSRDSINLWTPNAEQTASGSALWWHSSRILPVRSFLSFSNVNPGDISWLLFGGSRI